MVCVLRGGFSRVEQTLVDGGRGAAVIRQRMEFQELMRDRFEAVIEDATGRQVIGFMSGNQQDPDMMCEVFVLAPTDLLDGHELPDPGLPPAPDHAPGRPSSPRTRMPGGQRVIPASKGWCTPRAAAKIARGGHHVRPAWWAGIAI